MDGDASRGAAVATLAAFIVALVVVPLAEGPEFSPREIQLNAATFARRVPVMDDEALALQVSKLVALNTVSNRSLAPTHLSPEAQGKMKEAHALLRSFYPNLFAAATIETVNEYSLLITLPAHHDPSTHPPSRKSERPALLMCHLDVVPVEKGTAGRWGTEAGCDTCGPFSGAIHGGFVWGRGSLDMKQYCVTMLYAAERLLSRKRTTNPSGLPDLPPFLSARPIIFAIGHDEEVGGQAGHAMIVKHLRDKGISELEFVHDEGLPVLAQGTSKSNKDFDMGLIGLAEKGYLSVRVDCQGTGGHASMPPIVGTAVTLLTRALHALQLNPMPPSLPGPLREMIQTTAHRMGSLQAWAARRLVYFGPSLASHLAASDARTAALTTSSSAVTMIGGGFNEAALPESAWAIVNHRILPGDSVEQLISRDRLIVRNALPLGLENMCNVSVNPGSDVSEPSSISSSHALGFALIAGAMRAAFGDDLVISSSLFIAASDSRHYAPLANGRIFKHFPFKWTQADLDSIHSTDERVAIKSLPVAARYFCFLLLGSAMPTAVLEDMARPLENPN